MGKIEKDSQKRLRKTRITKAIVRTLNSVGVLAVAVFAPNLLKVLGNFQTINLAQRRRNINKSLERLIAEGYAELSGYGEKKKIKLTQKGKNLAMLLGEGRVAIKKSRRWDGKWRVLVFDIPEKRKKTRERIRFTLIDLGFLRLQDSVWVYPYDCEDIISLLKLDFKIGRELLYMIVDSIEGDTALRRSFKFS